MACHRTIHPVLDDAERIREGGYSLSGEDRITEEFTANAARLEVRGSSNTATIKRLLNSWEVGSDPESWRWEERQPGELDQQISDRPVRNLPTYRTPPRLPLMQLAETANPSHIPEASMSAVPVVLPVSDSSPIRQHSASQFQTSVAPNEREGIPSLAVAQTQIEPGVYGSRAQVKKKGGSKRRPGGF